MMQQNLLVLFFKYVTRYYPRIFKLTLQHLTISAIALVLTLIICVPLGIYITRKEKLAPYVIGLANIFQTIPSLALLGFRKLFF